MEEVQQKWATATMEIVIDFTYSPKLPILRPTLHSDTLNGGFTLIVCLLHPLCYRSADLLLRVRNGVSYRLGSLWWGIVVRSTIRHLGRAMVSSGYDRGRWWVVLVVIEVLVVRVVVMPTVIVPGGMQRT